MDLTVIRTGSFGTATITWAISASAGSTGASVMDVGASAGVVVIPNGADTATFPFTVRPDDTPEIDETFVVTLLLVNENNQMIRTQQVRKTQSVGKSTVTLQILFSATE